jgi:hypothetical protein
LNDKHCRTADGVFIPVDVYVLILGYRADQHQVKRALIKTLGHGSAHSSNQYFPAVPATALTKSGCGFLQQQLFLKMNHLKKVGLNPSGMVPTRISVQYTCLGK